MNRREERGLAQYEISQKRIDAMATWLDEIFSEKQDKYIQEFMNVYNQMLSTLGEKQKSAPADLYKLDSYWELHKNIRESLQLFGEEINTHMNSQLRSVYIEIYEGCCPGVEKVCTVSEQVIQKAIHRARGKASRNSEERVWMSMTILWDMLFGELMYCTIKHLSTDKLVSRLQSQFDTAKKTLKTSFSDAATFIQVRAVIKRGKDDRNEAAEIALANMATPALMSMRMFGDEGGGDYAGGDGYEDGDWGEEGAPGDTETEEGEEGGRVTIYVEWDDLVCEPCADLDGTTWDEEIWGDCPVPVHPNCRCWVEEAAPNPFDETAESIANNGFNSFGGMVLAIAAIAVLTLAGRMWDDLLQGGMSPGDWLQKWGDRYPV